MSNPFNFEAEPLKNRTNCGCHSQELDKDMAEFESEEEFRGGRRFPIRGRGASSQPLRRPLLSPRRPLRPSLAGPKQPWSRPTRPPYRRPRVSWPIARVPGVYREPDGFEPEPTAGSEYVRWAQSCLNQILGLQLPVSGVMDPETRSAVRSFQREQQLRTTGVLGPETEDALKAACGDPGERPPPTESESAPNYERWSDRGGLGAETEMELPSRFRLNYDTLVNRMKRQHKGLWEHSRCYLLSEWHRAPQKGTGVYLLIFRHPSRRSHIGYVGRSENLYARMRGYNRDVIALGHDPNDYAFCWYETPQYKSIEESLRRTLNPTGLVTNQRELELGLEWGEAEVPALGEVNGELGFESLLSEAEEIELAAELLSLSSENELDLFLGKFFKRIGSGLKKAGRFIGKRVLPVLGKGLKTLAKAALPIVGKVAGSFIPIPGVGTAIGGAIGTAVSNALELEFSGVTAEEAELEMARRFVQLAATAAQRAALSSPDSDAEVVVNEAIVSAARKHLPQFRLRKSERSGMPGTTQQGRWIRRDRHIVLLGA